MLSWTLVLLGAARVSLKSRNLLALENLALRQQLAMLRQSVRRPRVIFGDRLFWILYAKYVSGWRAPLHTLHPDTVVRWHRERFRRYWASISRSRRPGRPAIDSKLRNLIRTMQCANPCRGAPRIHGERSSSALRSPSRRIPKVTIARVNIWGGHHDTFK